MSAVVLGLAAAAGLAVLVDLAASTRWAVARTGGRVRGPLAAVLGGLVAVYRLAWSPRSAGMCRFEPSCSAYARDAVRAFGGVRGGLLAVRRVLRCQPLCAGGYDPVPARAARPARDNQKQDVDLAAPAGSGS
jgi:putative membrane protein insertion efficiency factor